MQIGIFLRDVHSKVSEANRDRDRDTRKGSGEHNESVSLPVGATGPEC